MGQAMFSTYVASTLIMNGYSYWIAFFVALAVMTLRRTDPNRRRVFQTPAVWIVGPLAAAGCLMLFAFLTLTAQLVFFGWGAIGLVFYFLYGRSRSNVARGIMEVAELDAPVSPIERVLKP